MQHSAVHQALRAKSKASADTIPPVTLWSQMGGSIHGKYGVPLFFRKPPNNCAGCWLNPQGFGSRVAGWLWDASGSYLWTERIGEVQDIATQQKKNCCLVLPSLNTHWAICFLTETILVEATVFFVEDWTIFLLSDFVCRLDKSPRWPKLKPSLNRRRAWIQSENRLSGDQQFHFLTVLGYFR
jgi:hypothetical protein